MEGRFNSVCPYHIGKCKCSFKRIGRARHHDGLSNGHDHDRSKATNSQAILHPINPEGLIPFSQPNNAVDTRVSRLIKCIERLGMDSTPIVYLPSRIGESEMLDKAAEALIHLSMGSGCGSNTIIPTTSARNKYAYAPSAAGSEIARASMTLAACSTFAIPCFQGTPSPFEVDHWLVAEPADLHPMTSDLRALNVCSHQLSVRLPRLIALIRHLRGKYSSDTPQQAMALSKSIYECRESAAESWILNRTKVFSPNTDMGTATYIPTAMAFASAREMTAVVLYWQSRIVATRIYNTLQTFLKTGLWQDTGTTAEELQLANNILMAWPYAHSTGSCATAPFTMGFICVWLVCRNITNFHGLQTSCFADWILRTLDVCHGGCAIGSTIMDLDATSDVLVGGPLIGHLADIVKTLRSV
ncbi:hypothetical protein M409DRAFT_50303 [Zasmidium cellare ATCC 36951]|uniref:Uncharacterized protein n=1 Tax=Zasmidium cellare ATCC 36951 TaxID=1080233 RepID=A0A6A6CWY9_ZASCE|nr:uncharacterized protein M409DRAFT_50303 [Zasmidium cellare ATCC 36951]KAF2171631.1 hypothetical protein M409DRAFT_50303 [Zasmidium cellare ATCC 36951]